MTTSNAGIDWHEGQPYSRQYGDVYFSRDSGLEETRHVFLEQNRLEARWRNLQTRHFTIGETGFGTGLNFLCAWQLWREMAPRNAHLHFVSVEKHPLAQADLAKALSLWPQLEEFSRELLVTYGWLSPGFHRLSLDGGRVMLTLLIGDVMEMLPKFNATVDAWFLDGFSPAKNPEMWQQPLFDRMASLSHAATTFATFTSAGIVKRGLQAGGFQVNKVRGHGRKRDMLAGTYLGNRSGPLHYKDRRAIVIGGGIAGTSTSHALAKRGFEVILIDKHGKIAQEASGNPVGILYPRLAGQDIILSRLALHGYLHTLRLLDQLQLPETAFQACGLLQLAFNDRERERIQAIAHRQLPPGIVHSLGPDAASAKARVPIPQEGLHFPAGGWVNPVMFCQALASQEGIQLMQGMISDIRKSTGKSLGQPYSLWQAWQDGQLLAEAPVLVIAAANRSAAFTQTQHLPLQPVRGQLTLLPRTSSGNRLKTVVCTDGYISPIINDYQCLGATFDPDNHSTETTHADHLQNLDMLRHSLPGVYQTLIQELDMKQVKGRVAFRAATPDYLPMAGPVLDAAALRLGPPRHTAPPSALPWLPGLFANTGHGSKGLINAPLCAEALVSAICGEPLPMDEKLIAALDPNRFILRELGLKRLALGLAAYPS